MPAGRTAAAHLLEVFVGAGVIAGIVRSSNNKVRITDHVRARQNRRLRRGLCDIPGECAAARPVASVRPVERGRIIQDTVIGVTAVRARYTEWTVVGTWVESVAAVIRDVAVHLEHSLVVDRAGVHARQEERQHGYRDRNGGEDAKPRRMARYFRKTSRQFFPPSVVCRLSQALFGFSVRTSLSYELLPSRWLAALVPGLAFVAEQPVRRLATGAALVPRLALVSELARRLVRQDRGDCRQRQERRDR